MAKSRLAEIQGKIELIKSWRLNGLTNEEIANNLGITRVSLYNYSKKDIDIFNALNESKEILDVEISNTLIDLIRDKATPHAVRLKSIQYYESTRTKWMPNDKREALNLRAKELEQKKRENDIEEQKIVISELGDDPVD